MKKLILIALIILFGSVLYSQPNPFSVTKYIKTTQDTIVLSRYQFNVKLTVESFGNPNDTVFIKTQRVDTNYNSEYFICKNNFSVNYTGTKFILKSNRDSVLIKYFIGDIKYLPYQDGMFITSYDTLSGSLVLSATKLQDTIKLYRQFTKLNLQSYTDSTGIDTVWVYIQNQRGHPFPVGVWNTALRTYADFILPTKSVYRDFGVDYWNPHWAIVKSNGKSSVKIDWSAIR